MSTEPVLTNPNSPRQLIVHPATWQGMVDHFGALGIQLVRVPGPGNLPTYSMRATPKPRHEPAAAPTPTPPANDVDDSSSRITSREREVLELLADGLDNGDVAAQLFVSRETVKSHLGKLSRKLGARNRTHAVAIALRRGLLHPEQL